MTDFTKEQIKQALFQNNGWNGGGVLNTPLNLTYSFGGAEMPYWHDFDYVFHGVNENTFRTLSSGQQAAFINAVALWESIANIHLTLGSPYSVTAGSTTLSFGDIVVMGGKLTDDTADASTISPTSTRSADSAGDIVIGNTGIANTHNNLLAPGQTGFNTFVHELGHALGLNHPINYPDQSSVTNPLPSDPGQRYTIMSYLPVKGIPGYSEWWASKPMLYDILAIQTLYGVNPNTNAEDDSSYTFKTGADAIQAIWDAGGVNDVIDAHYQTQHVTINLQPGHFSFVGKDEKTSQQQIAIAYQVTGQENNWIENAIGGSGNDELIGNNADNQLTGGKGNDHLEGGQGNDTYIYTQGDGFDTVLDSDGQGSITYDSATLSGGSQYGDARVHRDADKRLYVDVGQGLVIDGNLLIKNYQSGNLNINLTGAVAETNPQTTQNIAGDESFLNDSPGNDSISGGGGNDTIFAQLGGDDLINANAGQDKVNGGAGNDVIIGGADNDILAGGVGNDRLYADDQISVVDAIAAGNSQTGSGLKGEWLAGESGDDTLIGGVGNDVLTGGGGNDLLIGGAGDDDISGDANWVVNDFSWTVSTTNGEHLYTGAIGNMTPADSGADVIYAGTGDDYVWSGQGNDVLFGEDGNDSLNGQEGNDIMMGGAGNDIIGGQQGDDVLIGGAGEDYLIGGSGKDTYIFNRGDGRDTVIDTEKDSNLIFGAGISAGDITLRLSSLELDLGNGDQVHIDGFDQNDVFNSSSVSSFEFADGTELSIEQLLARGFDLDGTGQDDTITGTNTTDRIKGLDGNDTLIGGAGNDILDGGAGTDQLQGGAGDDLYLNVTGEDTITDTEGHNTLRLAQVNSIGAGGLTVVNYGDQGQYRRLDITLDNGETLKLEDAFFGTDATLQFANGNQLDLETLVGTSLTTALNLQLDNNGGKLYGGAGADILYGGSGADVLSGALGNDKLYGNAGNDTLKGGDGNDALDGGANDDTLIGGAGRDLLLGGSGNDVYEQSASSGADLITDTEGENIIRFAADISAANLTAGTLSIANQPALLMKVNGADATTIIGGFGNYSFEFADGSRMTSAEFLLNFRTDPQTVYGDDTGNTLYGGQAADTLYGQGGSDTLWGGAGDDLLLGGLGSDDYHYRPGDGHDVIEETDTPDAGQSSQDRVIFGAGIALSDVTFNHQPNGDLSLSVAGLADAITVTGWYSDPTKRVETFVFADGQQVTADTLAALDVTPLQGTAGNDSLNGTHYRDIIMAGAGDDLLTGNGGNDDLHGETGTDSYRLSQGSGADQVFEVEGETSVIEVTNYDLSRLTGTQVGNDLLLGVTGAGDSMTLKNFYTMNHDWQVKDQSSATRGLTGLLADNVAYRASRSEMDLLDEDFIARTQDKVAKYYRERGMELQADGTWRTPLQLSIIHQTENYVRSPGYNGYVPSGSSYYYLDTSSLEVGTISVSTYSSDAAEINQWDDYPLSFPNKNVQVEWGTPQTDSNSRVITGSIGHYLYTLEETIALMESLGVSGIVNPYVYTETTTYIQTTTIARQSATVLSVTPADGTGYNINQFNPLSFFQQGNFSSTFSMQVSNNDSNIRIINAGEGDNTISVGNNYGIVHAGGGNDSIDGSGGANMLLDGGTGDDLIYGSFTSSDTIIGGTGNDILYGNGGNDRYYLMLGDLGIDVLFDVDLYHYGSGNEADTVVFGEGINFANFSASWGSENGEGYWADMALHQTLNVSWQSGSVVKIAMPRADEEWWNKTGIEFFEFADGSRMTMAQMSELAGPSPEHAPVINTALEDQIATEDVPFTYTIPASALIDQDVGEVLSYSQNTWSEWLSFDPNTRTFSGTPNANTIYPINITVTAKDQFGASVSDTFTLTVNPINKITGTTGNDTLLGTAVSDKLTGLSGSDILYGELGADMLIGGQGDDMLYGGAGSDYYQFGLGSGADTLIDQTLSGSDDINTVAMGEGVLPENIIVNSDGSHIILSIEGATDKLTIRWDMQNGYFVQQVVFTDGTVWDAATLESMDIPLNVAPILVNSISDQNGVENHPFSFQISADTFHDTDSGDVLSHTAMRADGSPLPDWLSFNAATGTFAGTPGLNDAGTLALIVTATDQGGLSSNSAFSLNVANLIEATVYNDTIVGSAGNDYISTGAGNDTVNGGDGNDVIIGGTGSDLLAGGAGDDIFLISGSDSGYDRFQGDAGVDTIQGSAGDDVIRVNNFSGAYTVEKIDGGLGINTLAGTQYNDTVDLSATELVNIASIDGGLGNDTIIGSIGNDVIIGGTGSDLLAGGAGDDIFLISDSDSGYDRFQGDAGVDTIQGSAGDDVIRVNNFSGAYTVEKIDGGLGVNTLAGTQYNDTVDLSATELVNIALIDGGLGNDTLTGSAGNDVIVGGTGSDLLASGAGDDVFLIAGNDTGYDRFQGDVGIDTIQGGAGDDVIRVNNFSGAYTVEKIDGGLGINILAGTQYNDTIDLLATELINIASIDGGVGNDTIAGSVGNDAMDGGAGNDMLYGNGGNDILQGGADNDTLTGSASNEMFVGGTGNDTISTGKGADIIAFNRGDGMDIVNGGIGTDNTLSLGGGIQYFDLALSQSANDLIVEVGNGDQIALTGWYDTTANRKSVLNLQVIADVMAGFDPASSDPLLNKSIQNFDFTAIVNAFDQANGGSANFMHWSATDSLLTAHLSAGDSEALGGDLANQYGKNGTFSGFSQTAAQDVLSNPSFGASPQLLHDLAGLSEGMARLS